MNVAADILNFCCCLSVGVVEYEWSTYVIAAVQWLVFVIGSVGNLLVLVVLVWRRSASQVRIKFFLVVNFF